MCGATAGGATIDGVDLKGQSAIRGTVFVDDAPSAGVYIRLLDRSGEFVAEAPSSATGQFRFFAAPGEWTLRAISKHGTVDRSLVATLGEITELDVHIASA
jgi:hypothetical protein